MRSLSVLKTRLDPHAALPDRPGGQAPKDMTDLLPAGLVTAPASLWQTVAPMTTDARPPGRDPFAGARAALSATLRPRSRADRQEEDQQR